MALPREQRRIQIEANSDEFLIMKFPHQWPRIGGKGVGRPEPQNTNESHELILRKLETKGFPTQKKHLN